MPLNQPATLCQVDITKFFAVLSADVMPAFNILKKFEIGCITVPLNQLATPCHVEKTKSFAVCIVVCINVFKKLNRFEIGVIPKLSAF